ncbi:MAG: prepilin-type N-terminal cleavage/methylation domain-containing protein [Gammaproteobacteria bacterium]|nr:prepilin-type N-terminal cleavage/methylation domain-containing protein [Gammaproteobacteria bacterium]
MACITSQKIFIKNSGFTLVELIVVILIIGILSISIAPRFFGVTSYENRQVTDELLSALRYSQQMAMNRGGDIHLVLTANNFTVQLSDGTDLRSPDGRIPYTKTFPNNINATAETIRYNGLGQPVSAANVPLTANTAININGSPVITIEANTGYAH